ncbi:ABC transporter permease [Sporomusa termitida]|uniref:Glutathione transport system permease protein GsiD n=1 Tax=Sporomusa termitida TaxID=2377 RepID=A0A517DV36_9FIRM|nr:ABC transporter permease [Sporomusa termitida]QDR81213.1 Glutathione transport system permease protein GsiD [Sporomusa termitida]
MTGNTTAMFKKKSRIGENISRMRKNKIAMVGFVIFLAIAFCTLFADLIVPYHKAIDQDIVHRIQGISTQHWFGTDLYGRDMFARVVHATRNSLGLAIVAVAAGMTIGGLLGSCAGYYGGKVDAVIMRIMDTLMCIPFMLLALAIVAALGAGLVNVLIALVVSMIPSYTRIIRSAILTVVYQDFIEAARACGTSDTFIILKHIIPMAIGPVIVQSTMSVGTMIIWAASMSFLGMGVQPPAPEWGAMLSEGKNYMLVAPHLVVIPGLAIVLTALSLNLMGDGLRDVLDPRLKD